jgi:PAS domain S-box-containing protein
MRINNVIYIEDSDYFSVQYITIIAAVWSLILGSMVIAGWHSHDINLIQASSTLPPMQYNTALGFTLGGAGLLALVYASQRLTPIFAVAILMIGFLTLLEYIFGFNLHIDQFFMDDYILSDAPYPGRMAPNTALCFILTGGALLIACLKSDHKSGLAWGGALGALVVALGFVAMVGYLTGLETAYGWGQLTRMAIHTATGFIVTGFGIGAFIWHKGIIKKAGIPYWLPVSAGIGGMAFTIALWQAVNAAENKFIAQFGPESVNHADEGVLIFGFLLTAALVLSIHFATIAQKRLFIVMRSQKELQKLSRAVQQSPASIVITDTAGTIEYVNPKYCEVSGYSENELFGKNSRILKSGHQSQEFYQDLWETITSGREWRGELQNRKKNGELFWEYASISPVLNETGKITSFVGVKEDITRQKKAQDEASRLLSDNRRLSRQLMQSQEDERRYIARELHDELGQSLTAIDTVSRLISLNSSDEGVIDKANEIASITSELFKDVRSMLITIRPPMLDSVGLSAALENMTAQWKASADISCTLNIADNLDDFPDIVNIVIYRVLQECLTNISRHAMADRVEITLSTFARQSESDLSEGVLQLDIRDNGKGVNLEEPNVMGLGMVGIRERVHALGGSCAFNSLPGQGMHISITIPISTDKGEETI